MFETQINAGAAKAVGLSDPGEYSQAGQQGLRVAAVRDYFEQLQRAGAVREITREVSGKHELAAVTQASQRESDARAAVSQGDRARAFR